MARRSEASATGGASGATVLPTSGAPVVLPQRKKKRVVYVDDDDNIIGQEDEDEEVTDKPVFSLTLDEGVTVRGLQRRVCVALCMASANV
jgi:hypothetical protein